MVVSTMAQLGLPKGRFRAGEKIKKRKTDSPEINTLLGHLVTLNPSIPSFKSKAGKGLTFQR
jgi:hypothetical protein